MTILSSAVGTTYKVLSVANEEKLGRFLSTLGLIPNELITIISKAGSNYIVNIKDSRYAIDTALAGQIEIGAVTPNSVWNH